LNDSSLKNLNEALGGMIESFSVGDFQKLEEDGISEFEQLTNPPPDNPSTSTSSVLEIIDDYEEDKFFDCNEDTNDKKNLDASVIDKYIKEKTLRDRIDSLIQTSHKYCDLKFLINTLYESHRPGKTIKTVFSIGIVQMTLTSIWYNPILAAGFATYLSYVYIQDSAKPELKFQNAKAALGASALLFNNISPFIFDPAQSPFLFMTYLYFSVSAWSVLTSSLEKTKLLSKITYLTGANAFAIESPFVYLGALTLLQKGYLDDIIQKNLPTIVVSNFLPTIKANARQAAIDYLVTVSDILQDSFKTVTYLPYEIATNILESRKIAKEFVNMSKS
jgi:hypothetical protein